MPPPKDPMKYAEWLKKQSESHKGKTTWMKGKHHKQESIEKCRISKIGNQFRKGQKNSEIQNNKISFALSGRPSTFKGKKHTEEAKEKNRLAHIGKKHTDEWKKEQSLRHSGEKNPFYNKTHTEEFKLMISNLNTGKVSPMKGRNHSEETKALLKITRMNQVFPVKDTKPERIMQKALRLKGIEFRTHKALFGQPDIFIEPKLCLFVDGNYWHTRPEVVDRDIKVNKTLAEQDYQVIRIWENDILKDANACAESVLQFC